MWPAQRSTGAENEGDDDKQKLSKKAQKRDDGGEQPRMWIPVIFISALRRI